jgi:hypothetical protein
MNIMKKIKCIDKIMIYLGCVIFFYFPSIFCSFVQPEALVFTGSVVFLPNGAASLLLLYGYLRVTGCLCFDFFSVLYPKIKLLWARVKGVATLKPRSSDSDPPLRRL